MIARTYAVPAWVHTTRDAWVDEGVDMPGEDSPPAYLGVWIDPDQGLRWHLFSDYPPEHHVRFGWAAVL